MYIKILTINLLYHVNHCDIWLKRTSMKVNGGLLVSLNIDDKIQIAGHLD